VRAFAPREHPRADPAPQSSQPHARERHTHGVQRADDRPDGRVAVVDDQDTQIDPDRRTLVGRSSPTLDPCPA
jgi:hypothetical protein